MFLVSKPIKGALVRTNLSPIIGIFLTVFIDLLSFGLLIPDIQLRGKELGATSLQLGLSLGIFSLAQLITAPILGRISDRFGRRRVLLITCVLSCVSYVIYAHATDIYVVSLSRVFLGIAASNLPVAFAYVADVTTPEKRAQGMGTIGAAFGLGFVLGPGIGAWLLALGNNKPLLLGYASATLCFINFLYVLLLLPESAKHNADAGQNYFAMLGRAVKTPGMGILLLMFFAVNFGFTNLETTFFQLLADQRWIFHLKGESAPFAQNARDIGAVILTLVGLTSVFMQGFLVRALTPKFGEVKLLRVAYVGLVPVLGLIPFTPLWVPLFLMSILLAFCTGLAQPSISSLISRRAPEDMQGSIFGVTQSLGAIARFIGPLISNPLFGVQPYIPYVLGAGICIIPAAMSFYLKQPAGRALHAMEA